MLLDKPVPGPIKPLLQKLGIAEADVLVCTDADLDLRGDYAQQWLLLTKQRVLVFAVDGDTARLLREVAVADITRVWTQSRVGSSFFEVEIKEVRRELIRYTNSNAGKFATIGKKIKDLMAGREVVITPADGRDVRRCVKCGRMLPEGGTVCPACIKKGAMMLRVLKLMAPYWPLAVALLAVMFASMGLGLFTPQLTRALVDGVLKTEGKEEQAEASRPGDAEGQVGPAGGDPAAAVPAAPEEQPAAEAAAATESREDDGAGISDESGSSEEKHKPLPSWFLWLQRSTRRVRAMLFGVTVEQEADPLSGRLRLSLLALLVGLVVMMAVGRLGIGLLNARLGTRISNRVTYDMRARVVGRLQQLSVRYHDMHQPGMLMTRAIHDVEELGGFVSQVTSGFLYSLFMMASAALIVFALNWQLATWALIPTPFVMATTYIYYRYVRPRQRRFYDARSKLSDVVLAFLAGQRVVKAFAQEHRENERFNSYSGRYRRSRVRMDVASGTYSAFAGWFFTLGSPFVWWIGGAAVIRGEMTAGELLAFFGYLGMLYGPMSTLAGMNRWLTAFSTQVHRVFEVLDTQPEIERSEKAQPMKIRGNIHYDHVTFGYDHYNPVLHNVDLTIREGEMIGLVGHSGSGKTTFISLLCRFYDAGEGSIKIDGVDVRNIRVEDLRGQIGLVLQEPFLFRGTIADNIAYGVPHAKPEAILEAARAANAHDFITRSQDGYDTRLGESGSGLSGGERQRMSIARALLYNPRILILDEATSSVDTVTEREIQKALDVLVKGRTTIAAAHRLSTLQNCDRIVVFEGGYLREIGTHDELMARKGIYYRMVMIQTQLTKHKESVDDLTELTKEAKQAETEEKEKNKDTDKER